MVIRTDETFEIWNKEEVLKDVVSTIRGFQPDIIINRFDHRSEKNSWPSYRICYAQFEAFDLANDVIPHLTRSLATQKALFNTSWWFYGSRDNFEKADKTNLISLEVGNYYKLLGASIQKLLLTVKSTQISRIWNHDSRGEYKVFGDH